MLLSDGTTVKQGVITVTPETDETYEITVSGQIVNASAPTLPIGVLYAVVDGGPDTEITLLDQPTVASATALRQRIRGLTPGEYRLRITFLTSGNRRPVTLPIRCVE